MRILHARFTKAKFKTAISARNNTISIDGDSFPRASFSNHGGRARRNIRSTLIITIENRVRRESCNQFPFSKTAVFHSSIISRRGGEGGEDRKKERKKAMRGRIQIESGNEGSLQIFARRQRDEEKDRVDYPYIVLFQPTMIP